MKLVPKTEEGAEAKLNRDERPPKGQSGEAIGSRAGSGAVSSWQLRKFLFGKWLCILRFGCDDVGTGVVFDWRWSGESATYPTGIDLLPRSYTMCAATGLVLSMAALHCKSTGLGILSNAAKTLSISDSEGFW